MKVVKTVNRTAPLDTRKLHQATLPNANILHLATIIKIQRRTIQRTKMGKMPWTRSRSNGSRLQTGLIPRRRSRRLKKRVHFFKKEESQKSSNLLYKCSAARSLFTIRAISDLPNELTTKILTYFSATELMSLRCVDQHFKNLIDGTHNLWSKVSFHDMWPSTTGEYALFQKGADVGNVECLTKLGLSHLYHYNLTVGAEKNKKDVELHSVMAAHYLHNLDVNTAPQKPLTWMLIRPPWSLSRSICLKHLVHTQMLKFKQTKPAGSVFYNIGRVLNLEFDGDENKDEVKQNFTDSYDLNCTHAKLELLLAQRTQSASDAGNKLKWLRELKECARLGNTEALFELVRCNISNRQNENTTLNVEDLSRNLFKNCDYLRVDQLEQYQPKINSLMRCILVDWLAEVAYMKDMSHQVLHAAVTYVDRYLMSRVVERTKLQLLGISCLLLAAKSHYDTRQVHILTVRESSWLTDQTYQYEDVVKMMGEIIGTFRGDLWKPTSWNYLDTLLCFPLFDETWKAYSHYLHDMSLQFTSFGSFKPSTLACAIVFLAGIVLNRDEPWPQRFIQITGFTSKEIANCAALVHYRSFTCPSMKDDRNLPLESIKERYRSERNYCVAKMDILSEAEIKSRILSADSTLSCTSQEPLQFDVISAEIDDTFNMSTKSVDYDGDSEDSLNSDSEFDESFCFGRSRLSSYHSVEEFSDDETTMDAGSLHFNNKSTDHLPKDNFTPIFQSASNKNVFFEKKNSATAGFNGQYLKPIHFDGAFGEDLNEGGPSGNIEKRIVKSKQHSAVRFDPVGKRTRSNSAYK